jgi:glycosyltransferase involved in cell wall biosynthesis
MRALAITCVRNEEAHIANLIGGLIRDGLDVTMIDHGSTDRTVKIASQFLGKGLLEMRLLPWTGTFSLSTQLEHKWALAERAPHDWIVHVDADEWLKSPREGQRLIDAIEEVDRAGYNCINFNEFVFVPLPGEDVSRKNYRFALKRYYFFQPVYPHLQRAWKKNAGLDNRDGAGHLVSGDVRMCPEDFVMRHYIFLSEERARKKYVGRPFDRDEVIRGWHYDKIHATPENLSFPRKGDPHFDVLSEPSSERYNITRPLKKHYWEWAAELEENLAPHASPDLVIPVEVRRNMPTPIRREPRHATGS